MHRTGWACLYLRPAARVVGLLGFLALSACGESSDAIQLKFAAVLGATSAACGTEFSGIGTEQTTLRLKDLRFYISNIRLLAGEETRPVEMATASKWQADGVALLDFEDASADCSEFGTEETNSTVDIEANTSGVDGIAFTLGIPFTQNHQDASAAAPPLNLGALQWNWQAGYKFMRIDLLNEQTAPANGWFVHLGSTGCSSAGEAQAPSMECTRSNRVEVRLDGFDPTSSVITADIGRLLNNLDVSQNTTDTPPGCMSAGTDPECPDVFANLGLSLDTGDCVDDCTAQKLFSIVSRP